MKISRIEKKNEKSCGNINILIIANCIFIINECNILVAIDLVNLHVCNLKAYNLCKFINCCKIYS